MWFNLRGMLAALTALALLTSTASAEDLQFISSLAGQDAEAAEADIGCGGCDIGCGGCDIGCGDFNPCCDPWSLRTATYGFFAFDGWAQEPDDDNANNFGFRAGINAGIPLLRSRGIGAQIGASVGFYDLSGREQTRDASIEDQTMITAGVFKRADYCCGDPVSWAVVYDHQFHNNYAEDGADSFSLGQFRALIGYAISQRNELGVWFTQTNQDDDRLPAFDPAFTRFTVTAVNQYNVFWRRYWECGGDTMVYFGAVEDPGEFVVGLDARVPLNSRWALFCAGHYIKPSTDAGSRVVAEPYQEAIWNVSAGLMFFPGCNANSTSRWTPLLPVADNGTFALDQESRVSLLP